MHPAGEISPRLFPDLRKGPFASVARAFPCGKPCLNLSGRIILSKVWARARAGPSLLIWRPACDTVASGMNLSPERPVSALELPERPSRARTSRRALVGAALLLWGGVLWLYAPARRFDYVDFDDGVYVSGNAHVLTGLSISNALWAVTWNEGGNWHPVTWWSLMLDGTLFGARPAVFHMVNVVFHGLNAVLVFGVLVVLTGRWWPALAAAALFAVHPLGRVRCVDHGAQRRARVVLSARISSRLPVLCAAPARAVVGE